MRCRVRYVFLTVFALGCGGGADGDGSCGELEFLVTVTGPSGESVTDASVELDNVACTANGDGTYLCKGPGDAEEYNVAAVHPNYNAAATMVVPPEEGACDAPIPIALELGVMMGA